MNTLTKRIALAACVAACPIIASADEVTVTTKTNTITVTGTLVSFDDEVLVLQTELGQLRIMREMTNCEGASCPA